VALTWRTLQLERDSDDLLDEIKMTDFLLFLREQYEELGNFNPEFRLRSESDWPVTLDYWFGSPGWRESGHSFELIGVDGTGGMYCLWSYPQLNSPDVPVVFLGSEGEGVSVLASCVADLVEILAQGFVWHGQSMNYVKSEGDLDPDAFPKFSSHARDKFGRELRRPDDLLVLARQLHPDFKAWVDAQTT